jgi:hypothetical protein
VVLLLLERVVSCWASELFFSLSGFPADSFLAARFFSLAGLACFLQLVCWQGGQFPPWGMKQVQLLAFEQPTPLGLPF